MTALESIEIFENQMLNEIINSCADEISKEQLIEAVRETAATVRDTYYSEEK